jgi:hypothetical protein
MQNKKIAHLLNLKKGAERFLCCRIIFGGSMVVAVFIGTWGK